ncbi:unnamed protein product [Caenorhabditis auriculariae]|uniref:tRNA (34-2'-O)-methyltransferase regulator WDR6 n=1 Tax=Caenorhabditis auriculariae TaxID=2777116 RepID=A0A8S1H270_9PELO|nr:unnamed protein product [Caenorhabditis auriculariae]
MKRKSATSAARLGVFTTENFVFSVIGKLIEVHSKFGDVVSKYVANCNFDLIGIRAYENEELVLVYGARDVMIVQYETCFKKVTKCSQETVSNSYILDAILNKKTGTVSMIDASNVFKKLKVSEDGRITVSDVFSCPFIKESSTTALVVNIETEPKVFMATTNGEVKEWRPYSLSQKIITRKGHRGLILGICATEKYIFALGDDRTLLMWDINVNVKEDLSNLESSTMCSNRCEEFYVPALGSLLGHSSRPLSLCVDVKKNLVYSAGYEQFVYVWSFSKNNEDEENVDKKHEIKLVNKMAISYGPISTLHCTDDHMLMGTLSGGLILLKAKPVDDTLPRIQMQNFRDFAYLDKKSLVVIEKKDFISFIKDVKIHLHSEIKNKITNDFSRLANNTNSDFVIGWQKDFCTFIHNEWTFEKRFCKPISNVLTFEKFFLISFVDQTAKIGTFISDDLSLTFFNTIITNDTLNSAFFCEENNGELNVVIGTVHGDIYEGIVPKTETGNAWRGLAKIPSRKTNEYGQPLRSFGISQILKSSKFNTVMVLCGNEISHYLLQKTEQRVLKFLGKQQLPASIRISQLEQIVTCGSETFFVGFHGTSFTIADVDTLLPLANWESGGSNRKWLVWVDQEPESLIKTARFSFVRDGVLYFYEKTLNNVILLEPSFHIDQILDVAVVEDGERSYVATVSNDGNLTVSSINREAADFTQVRKVFTGDNVLAVDLTIDDSPSVFGAEPTFLVATGSGKSELSVWRLPIEGSNGVAPFQCSSLTTKDGGRITDIRIIEIEDENRFLASYSSGFIECFSLNDGNLTTVYSFDFSLESFGMAKFCSAQLYDCSYAFMATTMGATGVLTCEEARMSAVLVKNEFSYRSPGSPRCSAVERISDDFLLVAHGYDSGETVFYSFSEGKGLEFIDIVCDSTESIAAIAMDRIDVGKTRVSLVSFDSRLRSHIVDHMPEKDIVIGKAEDLETLSVHQPAAAVAVGKGRIFVVGHGSELVHE